MGAWTSAFTIGISNREVSALSTVKGYIPINLNIETNYPQFFKVAIQVIALVKPAAGSCVCCERRIRTSDP